MSNVKVIYPDVPVRAAAHTSSATFSDTAPISNLDDGRRDNNAAVTSSPTEVIINHDLGSGNTASVDHLVVARADNVTVSGSLMVRGSSVSRFAPSSIAGLTAWFDANRGTTVDADNLVGQWNDLSGNGYNATQATTANKPILSRTDNKENLLKYSEQFDNAAWIKVRSSIGATNATTAPDGTLTAEKLVDSIDNASHKIYQVVNVAYGETMTASVWLKAAELSYAALAITSQNETNRYLVRMNLSTGAFLSSTGTGTYEIINAGSGWWKLTITAALASGDTGTAFFIYTSNASTTAYAGTGTDGIYIWGAQLKRSTTASDYLQTVAYPKIASVNGNRALFFDGNQKIDSTSAGSVFAGIDKPATVFAALNPFHNLTTGSGASSAWCMSNTGVANPIFAVRVQASAGLQAIRRDDAGLTKSFNTSDGAKNSLGVISIVFNGTTATMYRNGTVSGTANTDLDTGTINFNVLNIGARGTTDWWYGLISEVIVYNSALSTTDRQTVEAYLTSKWQTAPVVNISNFNSQTLYGTRAKDFITTFSPSTAYRHWWIEFLGVTAFKPSKIYLGTDFDPVNSPDYSWRLIVPSEAKFTSGSGEIRANRTSTPRYIFELFWEGLTDAEVNTFAEKIWAKKHKSGFFLYTSAQPQILDNKTLVHVRLVSAEWERIGKANYNVLRAVFEEMV